MGRAEQQQVGRPRQGRVLKSLSHGGHVLAPAADGAEELARTQESILVAAQVVDEAGLDASTPFDYLFDDLAAGFPNNHLPNDDPASVVTALKALGAAMVENPPPTTDPLESTGNSSIPPIYTYWGQFIDHDLTANTDRDSTLSDITRDDLAPVTPATVASELKNLREPALNLDSMYGDGPTFDPSAPTAAADFYDGINLKIGTAATKQNDNTDVPGVRIPPEDDLNRDLPRVDKIAQIGDARNDENLAIAQLHTAFLRFHNAVVQWVKTNEADQHSSDEDIFYRAQQLVRWHYQWLVANDFLKTVMRAGVADQILLGGNRVFEPRNGQVYMPIEFSVACYRFGHSMVRGEYDWNRNFGRPGVPSGGGPPNTPLIPLANFNLLFVFTGKEGNPNKFAGRTDVLPFNWIAEFDRLVDKGSSLPDHFARKIDTQLAPPLRTLANEGNDATVQAVKDILKRLAVRNLLRGYLLAVPTGQKVAEKLGVAPLTSNELQQNNNAVVNDILQSAGFLDRTPLWYYVLKEAEVRVNGNSLGDVGSHVVCETIIGQIRNDPDSYLNADSWTPADGVHFDNGDLIVTISDLLRFAGVMR